MARNNNIIKQLVIEAKKQYERDAEHRVHIFLADTSVSSEPPPFSCDIEFLLTLVILVMQLWFVALDRCEAEETVELYCPRALYQGDASC